MKYKIAKLEDVAEALRSEYVADPAGGFVLKVDDLNVTELTASADEAKKLKEKQGVLTTETERTLAELNTKLAKTQEAQKKWQTQYYESTVAQKATEAFLKSGGTEKALPFVLDRIRSTFKFDDAGTLAPVDAEGKPLVNKDNKAHSIDSYIKDVLQVECDFMFKPSTGGGASGGGAQKVAGKNPFDPKTIDYTEQARITRTNPDLAKTLAQQAGQKV